MFDITENIIISTNTSYLGICVVLTQEDSENIMNIAGEASRELSAMEITYATVEKKVLGIEYLSISGY